MAFGAPRGLGHGIGLRHEHFGHILEEGVSGIDWMEIISENFFEPGGRPWAVLERVRQDVPVVMHGVSLSIGNTDPLSERYLDQLASLAERVEPEWVSDHLCWGGFGGHTAHDLLPIPYSEEALRHVVERVERVQEHLGRRILLENVSSYVSFRASAMTEHEFLREVVERADCGVLLDVNNIYVSSKNHGFDPLEYVEAIPVERVGQFHLAGHTDRGDLLIDTHLGPTPDPVWKLYERCVARFGRVAALVEWDEAVPQWDVVVAESTRARKIEEEVLSR